MPGGQGRSFHDSCAEQEREIMSCSIVKHFKKLVKISCELDHKGPD